MTASLDLFARSSALLRMPSWLGPDVHEEMKLAFGAIVRRLAGYGRFEGLEFLRALTRLYAAARIHMNVLQPSFKLRSKSRIGAKVVKRYHPPVPPATEARE